MKKLNFLSNLCSSSRTDRVRTLAIDAVSLPSFCRVNMLKLVSILVILLSLGVGQMWAAFTPLSLPYSWGYRDGKNAYTPELGCTKYNLGSDYSTDYCYLKFDNTNDSLVIQLAEAPTSLSYYIMKNGTYTGTFVVQESDNGSSYSALASYTSLNTTATYQSHSLKSTTRYLKFKYQSKTQGNVGLGTIAITAKCRTIDVTGGSAVILPAGKDSYTGGDWEGAGAPTAYPSSTTEYTIGTGNYCVTLTKAADYSKNSNGLQFQASNGVLLIEDITSNYGIDVEILIGSGSGFSIALDGATTLTGQDAGTRTISTTSTTADLTISKPTSGAGYVKYIKITPKTAATYSVTYNLNGGGGTTPTETNKAKDATFTLHNGTTNITAPAGKAFNKWKDQDDDLYSGGATYTMPAKDVTLTAQWSCITPTISGHPAAATYWDMDSPSALSVTASGGSLSYQWQMSANGSSGWSNVGTNSSSYTPLVANGTKYYRCVVTNTGSSCNTTATSNNALVTIKTLSSIAVKTEPKTTYFAGETFDPTGLVITLNASDASTQDRSYASYSSGFTFSPTTSTALTTSDDAVTITYGGESVDLDINVYSVTVEAKDEQGNTIVAGGPGNPTFTLATKAISPAADAANYKFKQWTISGAELGSAATTKGNSITNPTGNVTVTAVYYLPRTVTWLVNGEEWKPYTDKSSGTDGTAEVKYGDAWSTLTLPTDPNPLIDEGCGHKFMGWVAVPITGELDKDDDAAAITALDIMTSANQSSKTGAGHNVNNNITFYAVFADYVGE